MTIQDMDISLNICAKPVDKKVSERLKMLLNYYFHAEL